MKSGRMILFFKECKWKRLWMICHLEELALTLIIAGIQLVYESENASTLCDPDGLARLVECDAGGRTYLMFPKRSLAKSLRKS